MLRYFPRAYPDESIQSLLYRYCRVYGYRMSEVIKIIYDKREVYRHVNSLFGVQLDALSDILPKDYYLQMEQFYKEHTVMETYRPFMKMEAYDQLRNNVQYNFNGALRVLTADLDKNIKWCPECIKEDKSIFGEAYWHREHQPYGILVCWKHRCILNSISYQRILEMDTSNIYRQITNKPNIAELNNEEIEMAGIISVKYKELIEHINDFEDGNSLQENYFQKYVQYGYVAGNIIKAEKLKQKIRSRYREQFIYRIINTPNICRYFHNNNFFSSPIYNIFFSTSLFGEKFSVKDINYRIDYQLDELKKINKYKEEIKKTIVNKKNITVDELKVKNKLEIEYLKKIDEKYIITVFQEIEKNFQIVLEQCRKILQIYILENKGKKEIEQEISEICNFLKKHDKEGYDKKFTKNKSIIMTGEKERAFYKNKLKAYLRKYPDAKRTHVKKDLPSVYKWINKNAKEILDLEIPKKSIRLYEYRERFIKVAKKHRSRKKIKELIPIEYNYLQRKDKDWFESTLIEHIREKNSKEYRDNIRMDFQEYLKNNPTINRTQIKQEKNTIYRWFLKNDREWFEENAPNKR